MIEVSENYLSNTTFKDEVIYHSWCTSCKEKTSGLGLFASSEMKNRVLTLTSKAYYKFDVDEKCLKVRDYIRMPLQYIQCVTAPTTINLCIKSNHEGDKTNSSRSQEWLYCPDSMVTGRIDRGAIADEMISTFKRAARIVWCEANEGSAFK